MGDHTPSLDDTTTRRRWWRPVGSTAVVVALSLVAVACSSTTDEDVADTTASPIEQPSDDATSPSEEPSDDTASPSEEPSDDAASPSEEPSDDTASPSEQPSTASDAPSPSDEPSSDDPSTTDDATALPGEPWEGFARAGDVLVVVGVAHDDELNVRAVPGLAGAIVTTAAPTADDLVATGDARILEHTIWYEVTLDGVTGWASARHLAFGGTVVDDTAAYVADHGRPSAATLRELGRLVAEDYASTDPASRIVMSVAPSVGDLGEVSYDVIGIGDDSILGFRVHVFATRDGGGFTLRTIELWTFCARGGAGGLCA